MADDKKNPSKSNGGVVDILGAPEGFQGDILAEGRERAKARDREILAEVIDLKLDRYLKSEGANCLGFAGLIYEIVKTGGDVARELVAGIKWADLAPRPAPVQRASRGSKGTALTGDDKKVLADEVMAHLKANGDKFLTVGEIGKALSKDTPQLAPVLRYLEGANLILTAGEKRSKRYQFNANPPTPKVSDDKQANLPTVTHEVTA